MMTPRSAAERPIVLCAVIAAVLTLLPARAARAADDAGAAALSADDRKLLEGLINDLVVDPRGAKRVRIKAAVRSVWGGAEDVDREAWLVPAAGGKAARVFFTAGDSAPAPADQKQITDVDFVARCRKRFGPPTPEQEALEEGKVGGEDAAFNRTFEVMHTDSLGLFDDSDLVYAAWLHRLGHDDLAAKALRRVVARGPAAIGSPDAVAALRDRVGWYSFAGLVHAYMARADDEALDHGRRLLKFGPKADADGAYAQAPAIIAELERRRKKGTFGKAPPAADERPAGYDAWDAAKRVAYWIDQLDEVDARQSGQPGGVPLGSDPRVAALIKLGDAAVPALIDAIESDARLTRSVHFWRDFARSRTVLGVREAALTAVMSILRVRVFEPASTGDNFTLRGDDGAKQTVARLRAYWKANGGKPFDERMMAVLTDPKARPEALREAAANLATIDGDEMRGTMVGSSWQVVGGARTAPNPVIAKFKGPTVAEAVLAAMDRDLTAGHAAPAGEDRRGPHRRELVRQYLDTLVELGDQRIGGKLAERARAAEAQGDQRGRRRWAFAAYRLGATEPFARFAEDFAAGRITIPTKAEGRDADDEGDAAVELNDIVASLVAAAAGTPAADRALYALADAKHPFHEQAARAVGGGGRPNEAAWVAHPFCVAILRPLLDDTTPTGNRHRISEDGRRLHSETANGSGSSGMPALLADPAARLASASERRCDLAASTLASLVLGVPPTHPLLRDNEDRLARMRETLDRFGRRVRPVTAAERESLGESPWDSQFVLDLKPLGRGATDADVKAGRAVFALPPGQGTVADVKLPATGARKGAKPATRGLFGGHESRLLIVQAETQPDGKLKFGVMSEQGLQIMSAEDVVDVAEVKERKVKE